jgi:hypothetical protein
LRIDGPKKEYVKKYRETFKNLLQNHKAESFHIWYMATSRGPLHNYIVERIPLGSKMAPPQGSSFYVEIYRETVKNLLLRNPKAESFHIWYMATSRGPLHILLKESPWGLKWPGPRGQKFYIEIYYRETFKKLLLHSHKFESFHIWYMATYRGPLHILLKESPLGQNGPAPGVVFTLKYIGKL